MEVLREEQAGNEVYWGAGREQPSMTKGFFVDARWPTIVNSFSAKDL